MLTKSQVKYIQSLGHKKFRDDADCFVAEGPRLMGEWLQDKRVKFQAIYATPNWIAANPGVPATEVSEMELEKISQLQQPNQVLALVEKWKYELPGAPSGENYLALDAIQDPGNLGTIIRIADWFGWKHILCQPDTADMYNPKVVQASMGSVARVQLHYLPLRQWFDDFPGLRVYGADLQGKDIRRMEPLRDSVLLIGNEGKGINADLMERVNVKVTIPKMGEAESLNAAVATGILLSHLS
jgi:TrmH family RNA methyltransferase